MMTAPAAHRVVSERDAIDGLLKAGRVGAAVSALGDLWRRDPSLRTAAVVVSAFEAMRERLSLMPYRVAIARSFSVEPVIPLLRAEAFACGLDLAVHIGDFNAYAQELLDGESRLYAFAPDVIFLAVQTQDAAPDLWHDYLRMTPEARDAAMRRVVTAMADVIRAHRAHSSAHLVVHTLELPQQPAAGLLDAQSPGGQGATIHAINEQFRGLAQVHAGVYILPYDGLVARHGGLRWHDRGKWAAAAVPIAAEHLVHLAREWMRVLHPLTGKVAKVLAVDLDRTLWGGVVGEDGFEGVQIGPTYPGAAYQSFQRVLLDLRERGILLAVCSKNNPDDALRVLDQHQGMLVRREHFSAIRINWDDKANNLMAIAAELHVGTDALAFVDDDPVECELVRRQLPEATVIALPDDPNAYAATLADQPVFERLVLVAEDRARSVYYETERQRARLEESASTREDVYWALQQEVHVAPVTSATIARVAQLTQKTNQFNLTTRRYSEQEIAELASRPECRVVAARALDRYGDHGLIAVAITRDLGPLCHVEAFLLSCRVIARTIETAVLSHVVASARSRGLAAVQGWFRRTRKNAPAADFYQRHGFAAIEENGDDCLWRLELSRGDVLCPPWIRLIAAN